MVALQSTATGWLQYTIRAYVYLWKLIVMEFIDAMRFYQRKLGYLYMYLTIRTAIINVIFINAKNSTQEELMVIYKRYHNRHEFINFFALIFFPWLAVLLYDHPEWFSLKISTYDYCKVLFILTGSALWLHMLAVNLDIRAAISITVKDDFYVPWGFGHAAYLLWHWIRKFDPLYVLYYFVLSVQAVGLYSSFWPFPPV